MENIHCLFCNEVFKPRRSTARFCSDSHRTQYWLEHKEEKKDMGIPKQPQLRGIIQKNDLPVKEAEKPPIQPVFDWEEYMTQLNYENLIRWNNGCKKVLIAFVKPSDHPATLFTMIFGQNILGGLLNKPYKQFISKIGGYRESLFHKKAVNLFTNKEIADFQAIFYKEIQWMDWIIKVKAMNISSPVEQKLKGPETPQMKPVITNPVEITDTRQKSVISAPKMTSKIKPEPNSRILSSREFSGMDYPSLNFTGKWEQFIGSPSIYFHCVIHGKPGKGKSTFAIQFANYLAENFGAVLYISGEEGFSKTLKDKLINANALSDDLYIADFRKYSEIHAELKPNSYNFIVIDSLDTLGICAEQVRELRAVNDKTAFITISQSTKEGKMRGSNEIAHDADIVVEVDDGIATTSKNRFKEGNMKFEVFSGFRRDDTPDDRSKPLRNII